MKMGNSKQRRKEMKKANVFTILVSTAILLALCAGVQAQEKMETRDTRIGKLVFENGYPDHKTLEGC